MKGVRVGFLVQKVEKAPPWSPEAWLPALILLLCKLCELFPLSRPVSWLVMERKYQLLYLVVEKSRWNIASESIYKLQRITQIWNIIIWLISRSILQHGMRLVGGWNSPTDIKAWPISTYVKSQNFRNDIFSVHRSRDSRIEEIGAHLVQTPNPSTNSLKHTRPHQPLPEKKMHSHSLCTEMTLSFTYWSIHCFLPYPSPSF